MSKKLFGEASKCRNTRKNKQEIKKKLSRKKWKKNLFTIEIGAWKTSSPLPGRR